MPLDVAAERLVKMLAIAQNKDGAPPTMRSRREGLRELSALGADPPDPRVTSEDVVQVGLPLRLYRFDEAGRGVIVFVHGGGWVAGDLDTHDGVCRALAAESGAVVIAVDYPRPPEHPFPAAVEAVADVVDWVRQTLRPDHLVLAGDSAGAHVSLCALGRLRMRGSLPPDMVLLLCPIVEIEPSRPSRKMFRQGYFIDPRQFEQDVAGYRPDPDTALTSPSNADLHGHPPTLLHLAEYDPFRDEGLAYAERLEAAGVPVQAFVHPGMIHYFYALPRLIPHARTALAHAGRQVRSAANRVES
jgi:acetyl esterase